MFATAKADATVCLRCQFHSIFRQTRPGQRISRVAPEARSQQRRQSNRSGGSEVRQHGEPRISDNGGYYKKRISLFRGSKGRRAREAYEPLSIKSLGSDSEIIVLRDVETPEKEPLERQDDAEVASEQVQRPSEGSDLAVITGEEQPAPSQEEVNAAIDEHRPNQDVLTRKEFEVAARVLMESYTVLQLSRYLREELSNLNNSYGSNQVTEKPHLTRMINSTPWRLGTSPISVPLPMRKSDSHQLSARLSRKRAFIDKIFRDVWKVSVEDEAEANGELELLLTQDQWDLLHTKGTPELFDIMRSNTFHQRSRLQRDKLRLRVTGPRAEAEDIARLIEDAFWKSRHLNIFLEPLEGKGRVDAALLDKNSTFTVAQIKDIMKVTSTHIRVNRQTRVIKLLSFQQQNLDDALRLVLSLIRRPTRATYQTYQVNRNRKQWSHALVSSSGLPRWYRMKEIVRVSQTIPSEVTKEAQGSRNEGSVKTIIEGVIKNASTSGPEFQAAEAQGILVEQPSVSYWSSTGMIEPCAATLGYRLTNGSNDSAVLAKWSSESKAGAPSLRVLPAFSAQSLGLSTLLSFYAPSQPVQRRKAMTNIATSLVAHLVPSPLGKLGLEASIYYPKVDLVFALGRRGSASSQDDRQHVSDGHDGCSLTSIQAILHERVSDVGLSDMAVDVRFQRNEKVFGVPDLAHNDEHLGPFITSVLSSIGSGGQLQAPLHVKISIPKWMQRVFQKKGEIVIKPSETDPEKLVDYMFAGFEHKQVSEFTPMTSADEMEKRISDSHRLRVTELEAGWNGGRSTQVSLLAADAADTDLEPATSTENPLSDVVVDKATVWANILERRKKEQEAVVKEQLDDLHALIQASLNMAELVTDIRKGLVKPFEQQPRLQNVTDSSDSEQAEGDSDSQGSGIVLPDLKPPNAPDFDSSQQRQAELEEKMLQDGLSI